jgi:hypothetical protein
MEWVRAAERRGRGQMENKSRAETNESEGRRRNEETG